MKITIYTYGLKYKKTYLFDLDLDARILENPFYQENLRNLTGNDSEVIHFFMNQKQTFLYLETLVKFLDFYFSNIKKEHLNLGIHCTGGQHRSVYIAKYLKEYYKKYDIVVKNLELGDQYE